MSNTVADLDFALSPDIGHGAEEAGSIFSFVDTLVDCTALETGHGSMADWEFEVSTVITGGEHVKTVILAPLEHQIIVNDEMEMKNINPERNKRTGMKSERMCLFRWLDIFAHAG